MNSFHELIRNADLIFGKVKDYVFITKFQSGGLPHDHGLLCVQNAPTFGVSKNEEIECFIDKYLTDQVMFSIEIHNMQILNIKKHAKENINQFVDFNIQNHQ
jgi:hypothetical protein